MYVYVICVLLKFEVIRRYLGVKYCSCTRLCLYFNSVLRRGRNLPVDEDEAHGERSRGHLLQSLLAVGGTPRPGARALPARQADSGGGRRRAAASAVRRALCRRAFDHHQATSTTTTYGASRVGGTSQSCVVVTRARLLSAYTQTTGGGGMGQCPQ